MQLEYISASRLDTFLQCQMKYYAQYEEKLRDDPGEAARVGTAVHEAMELATNARIAGDDGPNSDPFHHLPESLEKENVMEFEADAISMINNAIAWGYFRSVGNCKGCEVEFKVPLPDGTNIYGFIDRLDISGKIADVKDLKTGKRAFEESDVPKKWQGRIYNIATRALYPEVEELAVSYWVLKHRVQRAVYTADDAARDADELVQLGMEIVACDNPTMTPSALCPWCPYVACPQRGAYKKKTYDNRRRK